MEIMEKIFGNAVKAKLMRVFVYNPELAFDINSLAKKIKSRPNLTRKEISVLEKAGLAKRKMTKNENGKKVNGWGLNQNFIFLEPLKKFLTEVSPLTDDRIAKRITSVGRVKLVVIAGIFVNQSDARVDLLVVSDKPDEKRFKKSLSEIESEFGRELAYVFLSTDDFIYRMSMGDKLVRDVFDFSHKVVLDKMGVQV